MSLSLLSQYIDHIHAHVPVIGPLYITFRLDIVAIDDDTLKANNFLFFSMSAQLESQIQMCMRMIELSLLPATKRD